MFTLISLSYELASYRVEVVSAADERKGLHGTLANNPKAHTTAISGHIHTVSTVNFANPKAVSLEKTKTSNSKE